MKRFAVLSLAAALLAAGFAGCEWGSSSNDKSWSDSFNWVNFSGEYRNGAGGRQIYTVIHQGQHLTITDGARGLVYEGTISSLRSSSGYENSKVQGVTGASQTVKSKEDHAMPPGNDTIIGSFEAKGAGGRMVGTLQGIVYDTNTDGKGDIFGGRTMTATLIGPTSVTQIEALCAANTSVTIFYPSTNSPVANTGN